MLSAKKIPPGKSGRIEVKIKTEELSGEEEKTVRVTTNDPRHPTVTLSIKAMVEPEILLSERMIDFGSVPQGKEVRKEIIVILPAKRSVRILSAASNDPCVMVKLDSMEDSGGKKVRLTAIQKADARPGYHFGLIEVKTDSSLTPKIFIYERGVVAVPDR